VYSQVQVKNRRLAYGVIVQPCGQKHPFKRSPCFFADAFLILVGFPATVDPALRSASADAIHQYVEELMSDTLLPFAKTKLSAKSEKKLRTLYQELQGVAPSSRRIILSAKSQMRKVIGERATDPVEQHIAELLGKKRLLSDELKVLIGQVCAAEHIPFQGPRPLNRSTKRQMLDWVSSNWDNIGQFMTSMAANQRVIPSRVEPPLGLLIR
jgi:hypothetical protein